MLVRAGNGVITGGPGNDDIEIQGGSYVASSGTGTSTLHQTYASNGGQNTILDGRLGTSTVAADDTDDRLSPDHLTSMSSVEVVSPSVNNYGVLCAGWSESDSPNFLPGSRWGTDRCPNPVDFHPLTGPWTESTRASPWRRCNDARGRVRVLERRQLLESGEHWASDAQYSVYDGSTLLGTVDVNQQNTCPSDSPDPSDHPWKLLGVYNITSGSVTVQLHDANPNPPQGEMLNFNDLMIRPIWPVVSIRADEDGTGQFGLYDDYLNAAGPAQIPVEGDGTPRLAVQLAQSRSTLCPDGGGQHERLEGDLAERCWVGVLTAATGGTQLDYVNRVATWWTTCCRPRALIARRYGSRSIPTAIRARMSARLLSRWTRLGISVTKTLRPGGGKWQIDHDVCAMGIRRQL